MRSHLVFQTKNINRNSAVYPSTHRASSCSIALRAQTTSRSDMSVLPAVSGRKASALGASVHSVERTRTQQKGRFVKASHVFTFALSQPVQQLVHRFHFSMDAPMDQINLPLFGRIDAPDTVPPALLRQAASYRQVVRLCWTLRRAKFLKPVDLAREFGFTRQHVTDYLHGDDAPKRRSLPAERIKDFEDVCGNTAITQWLAARQKFTLLEEMQAERACA